MLSVYYTGLKNDFYGGSYFYFLTNVLSVIKMYCAAHHKEIDGRGSMTRKTTGNHKQKKQPANRRPGRIVLLVLLELAAAGLLITIAGWNHGVKEWLGQFSRPVVKEIDIMGINSPYAVLIHARGGQQIAASRPDEQIYPASITKVMTALVAVEQIKDLSGQVRLTDECFEGLYEEDASQAGFETGEIVQIMDLLYGALLPSGAECCQALALTACGSVDAFVEKMNRKAQRLGMDQTHFTNTIGLHDENNYSTVSDLALLMKTAIRSRTLREILESEWHTTASTNLHPDGITFYSTMFRSLPDPTVTEGRILGGKTGYTSESGLCLASFAEIDGREYILVTADAPANGNPLHVYDAVTLYNRVGEAVQQLRGEQTGYMH